MDSQKQLDYYFTDLVNLNKYSGVVLITRGTETLFHKPYGFANRSWKIKNQIDTRFDTASITKLFTSIAILQLIDHGFISFDTPVIDFLHITNSTISKKVTVYHLLTHTSGIGDDVEEEDGQDYADLWKTKPNYSVRNTIDFLPQFIHKQPNFPPGEGCRYCNCSFILLGLMVEKVSGMDYREYVRQNVFKPAHMSHSEFLSMDIVHENVAEGCDPVLDDKGQVSVWEKNIYSFPPIGSPDGGAFVTANDLDCFLRRVKNGDLLSSNLTEQFLKPHEKYRQTETWKTMFGLGLSFYINNSNEIVCYQKDGINAGVSAIIRHFPDRDINVVLLSNMASGVWNPIWHIHEMVAAGQFD